MQTRLYDLSFLQVVLRAERERERERERTQWRGIKVVRILSLTSHVSNVALTMRMHNSYLAGAAFLSLAVTFVPVFQI